MSKVGQFQKSMPYKVGQFQPKGDAVGKMGGKKAGPDASQATRLAMLKNRFKKHGDDEGEETVVENEE